MKGGLMPSNHYVEKCKVCLKVMSQCRCPSTVKATRWGICKECTR